MRSAIDHPLLTWFFLAWMLLPIASAQTVDYPVSTSETLSDWGQEWTFWASDGPPPSWPISVLPEAQDARLLLAEVASSPLHKRELISTARSDADRVLMLRHDYLGLITDSVWWSGFNAPFSGRSELRWLAFERQWKKNHRADRTNGEYASRSQMVFPVGRRPSMLEDDQVRVDKSAMEPGLTNLYFARSFTVEDPSQFTALQLHGRFNKGIRIFLNGELVAKARINGSLTGHGEFGVELDVPDFVQMDVGPEDWWETQWSGIPTSLLQPGENVISAVLHKAETGGSPSFYFDLQVRAWTDIGWVKLPYLHQASQTGVTVSWETTVPTRGRIEVSNARGSAVRTVLDSFLGIHHEVVVDGLKPGTDYRYRVVAIPEGGAEELKGDLYGFSTAPREDQGFSFLFYGDSRTGKTVHRKLANLMVADRAEYDSNMVVHAGDIVSWGYAWDRWQERFFAPAWPLLSQVPIYPTVGNHELNQKLYYDYFDLPGNESWYHFRYGIADFFAVNSNVDYKRGSEQYKWFEAALKASEAPWKVVFLHHPPFACATSRKPGNTRVKEHLVPLMEEYGVDLVLLGHDHLYGRSRKVNGVTYVISGGGGSALYSAKPDSIMQVCEKRYNYVRFHVSEEAIKWVAIAEDGQIIEEYEINP